MRKMFTEKQISEIAKSSVSGGTKLYWHVILCNMNDESQIEINVIKYSNQKVESVSEIRIYAIKYLDADGNDLIYSDLDFTYYLVNIGQLDNYLIGNDVASIESDTIEPL